MTSSAHDADLKGNNFRRNIHPQSFIAVAFIFSELRGLPERPPPPPPQVQKVEKTPGLDGVKASIYLFIIIFKKLLKDNFIRLIYPSTDKEKTTPKCVKPIQTGLVLVFCDQWGGLSLLRSSANIKL